MLIMHLTSISNRAIRSIKVLPFDVIFITIFVMMCIISLFNFYKKIFYASNDN